MKTTLNTKSQVESLPVQTKQFAPEKQSPPATTSEARPRIDFARRQLNRQLGTQALLALLRTEAPSFYEVAEIVGKWVWIQFTEKQAPAITARLAEFGFHWNNKRQAWQHPCGPGTAEGSPDDPRAKYGSVFAADQQAA